MLFANTNVMSKHIFSVPCPICSEMGYHNELLIPQPETDRNIQCVSCNSILKYSKDGFKLRGSSPLGKKVSIFKGKGADDIRAILRIVGTKGRATAYDVKLALHKNYSIAYRGVARLKTEKEGYIHEVDKRIGKKKSTFVPLYSLTKKGIIATLAIMPINDEDGFRNFVKYNSSHSLILRLVDVLMKNDVPYHFIEKALILPVKKEVLRMLEEFRHIHSDFTILSPNLEELDMVVFPLIEISLLEEFGEMFRNNRQQIKSLMKAFKDEDVLKILFQLRKQNFLLTLWGSIAASMAKDMKLSDVEQELSEILRFHNLLSSTNIKMPREIVTNMLDKMKPAFKELDLSNQSLLE